MTSHKVMIVDDDEDIRLVTSISISRVGKWQALAVASGEEALETARGERPDLILLDVMMPDLDGPGLMARLREDPETAGIPVIFLTARVQSHEIEHYLDLGAIGVIRKPFDVMKLPDEIRRLCQWS